MQLVAVEPPSLAMSPAGPRELDDLFDITVRRLQASELLQVIANDLVQTLAHRSRGIAGAIVDLLIGGQRDISLRWIRTQVTCAHYVRSCRVSTWRPTRFAHLLKEYQREIPRPAEWGIVVLLRSDAHYKVH